MRNAIIAAIIGFSVSARAADQATFDRSFEDATMRIDYHHGGDAKDEGVALDRVYRQGIWAGSRVHLLDPFPVGRYVAEVLEIPSEKPLFNKRFDSYFGEYRTTAEAAKGIKRTYHESVLIPYPKTKVRLVIKVRQNDQSHKTLLDVELDPQAFTVNREPLIDGVKVIPIRQSGDPHKTVDVAIVAEGYTSADERKLRADLDRFGTLLFSQEPFASTKDRFNLVGVWKPSQQSGCDEPSRGIWRNTPVGTGFDALASERYLLTEDNRALRDIAAHVPYDAIYVMVNHPRYGGGGIYNLYCTFTSDNQWAPYIFLHEFGHSFAGLADEYYTSSVAYTDFFPKGTEPEVPNVTALRNPAALKWKDLVSPGIALPTPWEKEGYDRQDIEYQKIRESINKQIAAASREGLPVERIDALKNQAERLSQDNAASLDRYLAKSRFAGKVGAFEGGYSSKGLYRPALDCIMFSKGTKPFCPVCERAIRLVIDHYGE